MTIETASIGKLLWVLGVIAWYVIRYPFERRAKRVRIVSDRSSLSDRLALVAALFGLAFVPALYVATGFPRSADYPTSIAAILLGAILLSHRIVVVSHLPQAIGPQLVDYLADPREA